MNLDSFFFLFSLVQEELDLTFLSTSQPKGFCLHAQLTVDCALDIRQDFDFVDRTRLVSCLTE